MPAPAPPQPLTPSQLAAFRAEAEHTRGIDLPVYAAHGRDWRDPLFGLGPANAPLCIFGRDPGGTEVAHGLPFIGRGGQLVRAALHRQLHDPQAGAPTFDESIAAGAQVFWLNTVPYKPVGNKAWSMAVKRRFQPLVAELLMGRWHGSTVLVLGREAFFWFGIGQDAAVQAALDAFWARDDRYTATLSINYRHAGQSRALTLAPLPHPSPANAVWFGRFAGLMDARLGPLRLSP
ncbi:uracil-DNA glycosylase family protein [Xylophilus sp. GW821-FHT01B05]